MRDLNKYLYLKTDIKGCLRNLENRNIRIQIKTYMVKQNWSQMSIQVSSIFKYRKIKINTKHCTKEARENSKMNYL